MPALSPSPLSVLPRQRVLPQHLHLHPLRVRSTRVDLPSVASSLTGLRCQVGHFQSANQPVGQSPVAGTSTPTQCCWGVALLLLVGLLHQFWGRPSTPPCALLISCAHVLASAKPGFFLLFFRICFGPNKQSIHPSWLSLSPSLSLPLSLSLLLLFCCGF